MAKYLTSRQWLKDRSHRELHDHYHALGVIEDRWNTAELQMQRLCWFFLGAGPERGRAATNEMGNITLSNFLLTLAVEAAKFPKAIAFAEGAAKLFNTNRDNRNFLTHCRIFFPTNVPHHLKILGFAVLQRFQAKGKFNHTMYVMPISTLREIADEISAWNEYVGRFLDYVAAGHSNEVTPLPDRPPMPQKMEHRLLSFQPVDAPPKKPSRRK